MRTVVLVVQELRELLLRSVAMTRAALLLAIAACGPSLREIDDHNRRAIQTADTRIGDAGPPFTPATVSIPLTTPAIAAPGLETDEKLYVDPSGQLVLVSTACAVPARCGNACARPVDYSFHHATDGHVVIVRKRVVEQIVRQEKDSSCPAGCGGGARPSEPAPQPDIAGLGLGVTAVAQVELRTVAYTQQVVDRVCTNTTPVP